MTGYQRVGSFECSPVAAVGVTEGLMGVAGDRQVTLVTASDRTTFDHDEPIVDVALGERVVVLSASQLTAYDRSGARIWNRTFSDAHAVATRPGTGQIGVLEPNQLRLLDPGTGQETMVADRSPPGRPDDDLLLGTQAGFVTATWSVLQRFDHEGDVVFDSNLDAAIRDIGCCDGVLVVALQNGKLRGIDAETGERRWETELPVTQLSPRGEGVLLLRSDDGVKTVGPDGSLDSAGSVATGDVYADTSGSFVCSVRDGAVTTHVPAGELLDIDVLTETVGVGGTIELEATNRGETAERLTVTGALSHADLSPSERRLRIPPGESTVADFPVESVRTDGEAEFTATVENQVVARRAVAITDAAQSTVTAEATLEPVGVDDDVVELELAVENTGENPLDSVSELASGAETTEVGPGESWTTRITKPFEPDRKLTVGLEVVRANRRTELAPTCQLPSLPSIDIEQRRDALHARIEADESVTWSDELVIEAPGADRVRSPVAIEDGGLLLVLPVYESGVARIALSKLGVSEQARMTEQGPLSGLGSGGTDRAADRRAASASRNRSDEETENTDSATSPGERRSNARGDETGAAAGSPDSTTGGRSETGPTGQSDAAGTDRTVGTAEPDTDGENRPTSAGAGTGCRVDRRLSAESATVGHVVEERLTVTNDGATPVAPRLRLGENRVDVGELRPDESRVFRQELARFASDDGSLSLPAAELVVDGATVDELPSATVDADPGGLAVRGVVDPADGSYEVEVTNQTGEECRLTAIEIGGQQHDSNQRVPPGESASLSGTLQSQLPADRDVVTGTFTTADGETVRAALLVGSLGGTSDGVEGLTTAIGSATRVAGDYGTVVLIVENDAGRPLSDVTVRADGEMINDILYSEAQREQLAPGDRIEHYVDLKTTAGTVDIEFTASYATDGGRETHRFSATGPAVNTESEWTDSHREAWTLTAETDAAAGEIEFPSTVSTGYSRVD